MSTCPRPWSAVVKLCALLSLTFIAACRDSAPTAPGTDPQFDIFESRFDGGNPDFFFASPLATNPMLGDPGFDPGAANGALVPYLRVCTTDGAESPAGCLDDVTLQVTGSDTGLPMTFDPVTELYQVNWRSNLLNENLEYRIEIWGVELASAERAGLLAITFPSDHSLLPDHPRFLFGWRDIDDSPSTASCSGLEEFCFVNYGQTIPVKVRIEDTIVCPVARDCEVQFVAAGEGANLRAIFGGGQEVSPARFFQAPTGPAAGWAELSVPGSEDGYVLAFLPCTDAEWASVQAFAAIPVFRPCVRSLSTEELVFDDAVRLSYCLEVDQSVIAGQLAHPESQLELVGVHHFDTGGDPTAAIRQMEAWREVSPVCVEPPEALESGGSGGAFLRVAQAAGKRVLSLFGPQPLVALDRGGGGEGDKANSFWALGLPSRAVYEQPGDQFQTGAAGSAHTLRAKVVDLNGDPVWRATPSWSLASAPAGDASVVSYSATTGMDGISQASVMLASVEGNNVFHMDGDHGIADARESGCTLFGGVVGAAACNGPRASFDPWQPDESAAMSTFLTIPSGTFLPFTVYGCIPGRGTPEAHDGAIDAGWACALSRTIQVNLSGGSTVEGTLYWMNDDTHFHVAASVPGSERRNDFRIEWNNNYAGPPSLAEGGVYGASREIGDDVWVFEPGSGTNDKFVDEQCSGSGQAGCGSDDGPDLGGDNQTTAGFDNTTGGMTVYEVSHPLSTGDVCDNDHRTRGCGAALGASIDLDLTVGDEAGFFVSLQLGNGAQGNTQDPGFLQYLKVVIH